MLLCGLGLATPGQVGHDGEPGRTWMPVHGPGVYRNEWTGLTEPRVVQGALEGLADLGWLRPEAVRVREGGRRTVRFRINPRLLAGRRGRSRQVPRRLPEVPAGRHAAVV